MHPLFNSHSNTTVPRFWRRKLHFRKCPSWLKISHLESNPGKISLLSGGNACSPEIHMAHCSTSCRSVYKSHHRGRISLNTLFEKKTNFLPRSTHPATPGSLTHPPTPTPQHQHSLIPGCFPFSTALLHLPFYIVHLFMLFLSIYHQLNVRSIRTRILPLVLFVLSSVLKTEFKKSWVCLKSHESRIWTLYHHHMILSIPVTHCKMLWRLSSFVKTLSMHHKKANWVKTLLWKTRPYD